MSAEERCRYCGKPIAHLEIYEVCPCTIGKSQEELEQSYQRRIAQEIPLYGADGD